MKINIIVLSENKPLISDDNVCTYHIGMCSIKTHILKFNDVPFVRIRPEKLEQLLTELFDLKNRPITVFLQNYTSLDQTKFFYIQSKCVSSILQYDGTINSDEDTITVVFNDNEYHELFINMDTLKRFRGNRRQFVMMIDSIFELRGPKLDPQIFRELRDTW